MRPELFRIPIPFTDYSIPVLGFGLMLVLGFFVPLAVGKFLGRRTRIDPDHVVNATLLAIVFGVLGARLSHVLENWHEYWRPGVPLWRMFDLREGGLTYYGGFILATAVCVAYALWKRVPLRLGMDIIAICLMGGLGFGRLGCFLNGCCFGRECSAAAVPWRVTFPYNSFAYQQQWERGQVHVPSGLVGIDAKGKSRLTPLDQVDDPALRDWAAAQRSLPVHPAQLYSSFTAFLLAGLLFAYFTLPHAPGRVFALMLILEGAARFILEMLRTEPTVWGRLSMAQVTSLFLVPAGIIMWVVCGHLARKPGWHDNRWEGFAPVPTVQPSER